MYLFRFLYENGTDLTFEHIQRVVYTHAGHTHTVEKQDLITHTFPLGATFQLLADDSNFIISSNHLVYIEVTTEN